MIRLRHCTIEFTDWGCLTKYPDGTEVGAWPDGGRHYTVITHRLGYGDDTMAYSREHEVAHSFLAEKLHDAPSAVLKAMAEKRMLSGRQSAHEEIATQAFQRFVRANERPIVSGLPDIDAWKAEFIRLVDEEKERMMGIASKGWASQFMISRDFIVMDALSDVKPTQLDISDQIALSQKFFDELVDKGEAVPPEGINPAVSKAVRQHYKRTL